MVSDNLVAILNFPSSDRPLSGPTPESREASPINADQLQDELNEFFGGLPSFQQHAAFDPPHRQPTTAVFNPEAFEAESKRKVGARVEEEKLFVSEDPWTRYHNGYGIIN